MSKMYIKGALNPNEIFESININHVRGGVGTVLKVQADLDLYRILSGRQDDWSLRHYINKAFEAEIEAEANRKGFSYKYTIINGKVYRRSLIESIDKAK